MSDPVIRTVGFRPVSHPLTGEEALERPSVAERALTQPPRLGRASNLPAVSESHVIVLGTLVWLSFFWHAPAILPPILLPTALTNSFIKIVYLLRFKPNDANGKNQIYQNR